MARTTTSRSTESTQTAPDARNRQRKEQDKPRENPTTRRSGRPSSNSRTITIAKMDATPKVDRRQKYRDEHSRVIEVPFKCTPAQLPPFKSCIKSAGRSFSAYIQDLQQNDIVARPRNYREVLSSRCITGAPKHPWNDITAIHYCVAATNQDVETELKNGLILPVLVLPSSQIGKEVLSATEWPKMSLSQLLDEILKDPNANVSVQDHEKTSFVLFNASMKCHEVRKWFSKSPESRQYGYNLLDVDDRLKGHKGPKCFENGGKLRDWQFTREDQGDMGRSKWEAMGGAKRNDKWLLVSGANSGSFAHIDVAWATWVACLRGKKTFWIRNPTTVDLRVWRKSDGAVDHRVFEEPWGRIDLTPGMILIFPPGTIHVVFTHEDTICSGGHFIFPQIMDRFLDALAQTEMDASLTNDSKSVDFFVVVENFIRETLTKPELSRHQLQRFIFALEDYIETELGEEQNEDADDTSQDGEASHFKRRAAFVNLLHRESWVSALKQKVSQMV